MVNLQLAEKQVHADEDGLSVQEIFPTIQGEGPYAGTPSIFLRLAGCNLQCPLCDTDYTSRRHPLLLHEVEREVSRYPYKKLVVITGGEPFRQPCGPLVNLLIRRGYRVQFETNGTLYDESMEGAFQLVTIVCSPKAGVNPRLTPHIDCYKYILSADKVDEDGLPTESLNFGVRPARPHDGFGGTIYVQPCDDQDAEKNRANTQAAIDSCMRHGYTLCLQLHKIVGLP